MSEYAICENCGKELIGFDAEHYENQVVFCSLECNEEFSGDEE